MAGVAEEASTRGFGAPGFAGLPSSTVALWAQSHSRGVHRGGQDDSANACALLRAPRQYSVCPLCHVYKETNVECDSFRPTELPRAPV
jgi:hypothetical protein